jgi:hypothetical protein
MISHKYGSEATTQSWKEKRRVRGRKGEVRGER